MGGFGALRTAFKYPQMFSAVAAHSAALIEKMPRGAENTPVGMILGSVFGSPFDPSYWESQSPFAFAKTANLSGLKIYFDCGDQDSYGFDAGARALDTLLTKRKVAHEFHIYPGGHDWQYFAAHLPASLQFVSQAFAGKTASAHAATNNPYPHSNFPSRSGFRYVQSHDCYCDCHSLVAHRRAARARHR